MTAWLAIGLLVLTVAGCARPDWIEQTLVTVDVTGVWQGTHETGGLGSLGLVELTPKQSGPKVTGEIRMAPGGADNGPIEGSVSGDVFRYHNSRGELTGELHVNGEEMIGVGTWKYGSISITLRRQ